ncbi:MAG: hypothetical protein NC936_06250, partial [Candidatus Omnitrophica bacterium]|nr:hypothetical protein [Candidatus Omnitrophota bacterium]
MGYREHFILALAFSSITTFFLGLFVYFKNKKSRTNITFGLFCLSIAWWSGTQIGNVYGPTLEASWFWARIEQIGVVFIPTFFLHFVFSFLEIKDKKWLLRFCYLFSIIIAILSPTTSLISPRAERKFGIINFGEPGPLYGVLVAFFVICIIYGIHRLYKACLYSTGAKRNQLKYLLVAYIIGYFGGAANFFLVWDINIPILNPFGTYLAPVHVFIIAYAILRYRLMDIRVAVTRAGIFAVVYTLVLGLPFVAIKFLKPVLMPLWGAYWWMSILI